MNTGIVVTNCYNPVFTRLAVESVRQFYPDIGIVVVDDRCIECAGELKDIAEDFDVTLLKNPERLGAGRALDLGFRHFDTRHILTCEHGVRLKAPGVIEFLSRHIGEGVIAVGHRRGNNRGTKRLGPYLDPWLALWDREFIVGHDLSFILTALRLPDGERVPSCSTAQYLCYRIQKLGGRLAWVSLRPYASHAHDRSSFAKKWPSPHVLVKLEGGEIDIPARG